jgi:hypothetical protein
MKSGLKNETEKMENCEVLSTQVFTHIMFRLLDVFRITEQKCENLILAEILIL